MPITLLYDICCISVGGVSFIFKFELLDFNCLVLNQHEKYLIELADQVAFINIYSLLIFFM